MIEELDLRGDGDLVAGGLPLTEGDREDVEAGD